MEFDLSGDGDVLVLTALWSEKQRGTGHATRALNHLCELADAHSVTITLEVCRLLYDLDVCSDDDLDRLDALNQLAMNDEQLEAWYARFGFEPDERNTPDSAAVMRRRPGPKLSPELRRQPT